MNLLPTDPLKGLLDMRLGGGLSTPTAPDSDLMDVVLMGQSHENLFRGQMGVSGASAGGGGVTQDALERAGLFSTVNSNPIAGLTGGSIKSQPTHNQSLLDKTITRTMKAGTKFYNDGNPMEPTAAEDFLPDYDDLMKFSDTESVKSTNIPDSLRGSDDEEEEAKSDSDSDDESQQPQPFPTSKFEKNDAKNFVFGSKKKYKKSDGKDADEVKEKKRELKQQKAQAQRQEQIRQKRAAKKVSKAAKKAHWMDVAKNKMAAEMGGQTYMANMRRNVKDTPKRLAQSISKSNAKKAEKRATAFKTYQSEAIEASLRRPNIGRLAEVQETKQRQNIKQLDRQRQQEAVLSFKKKNRTVAKKKKGDK